MNRFFFLHTNKHINSMFLSRLNLRGIHKFLNVELLEDVEKLGSKGNVVAVSKGFVFCRSESRFSYARNFLLPRNLVKVVNKRVEIVREKKV